MSEPRTSQRVAAADCRIARRRLFRSVAVTLGVLLTSVVWPWAAPADAHSSLVGASPAPDDTVGGDVVFIELAFNEPVSDATISVLYNQEPLAGVTTVADGELLRFDLSEALVQPGRYEVSYDMISFDTDHTIDGFFFTFDPAGPQPVAIDLSTGQGLGQELSEGTDWGFFAAVGVLIASLFGLLGIFVWRVDAKRRAEAFD